MPPKDIENGGLCVPEDIDRHLQLGLRPSSQLPISGDSITSRLLHALCKCGVLIENALLTGVEPIMVVLEPVSIGMFETNSLSLFV